MNNTSVSFNSSNSQKVPCKGIFQSGQYQETGPSARHLSLRYEMNEKRNPDGGGASQTPVSIHPEGNQRYEWNVDTSIHLIKLDLRFSDSFSSRLRRLKLRV